MVKTQILFQEKVLTGMLEGEVLLFVQKPQFGVLSIVAVVSGMTGKKGREAFSSVRSRVVLLFLS